MEFKIGDKVRFLNEKGGGIVTGLISTSMVQVAIEEGFEVPVMVNQLIKIEPGGMADRFFDRPLNIKNEIANLSSQSSENSPDRAKSDSGGDKGNIEKDPVTPVFRSSGAGVIEGIYLVWEPTDQQWLITGNLNIYIVNYTPMDVIYSLILKEEDDKYSGVNYDVISPYSKYHIETITREDLEAWSNGVVQVLFQSEDMGVLYRPLHSTFKVKSSRFFKETSYRDYIPTASKVIVLEIGDLVSQKISDDDLTLKFNIDPEVRQKVDAVATKALIDRHKIAHREAEVDLHISALIDDYSKMPHNEILNYQLSYFENMLESAIAYSYNRVVFIHGIGNGILKEALIRRLKNYENIELRKAKFDKYGNGAIEIIIHQ